MQVTIEIHKVLLDERDSISDTVKMYQANGWKFAKGVELGSKLTEIEFTRSAQDRQHWCRLNGKIFSDTVPIIGSPA